MLWCCDNSCCGGVAGEENRKTERIKKRCRSKKKKPLLDGDQKRSLVLVQRKVKKGQSVVMRGNQSS